MANTPAAPPADAGVVAERPPLAIEIKNTVVDVVEARVAEMATSGELIMPADYSHQNAMKSAWLELQTVVDRNKKLALEVCTKDSIANALLNMCTQGLNVARTQGYFIVYGNQLAFQRSYFGDMALVARVHPEVEFAYSVVWAGDAVELEIVDGNRRIKSHTSSLENIGGEITHAYCTVTPGENRKPKTVIMTRADIEKAWQQSKTYKAGGTSPHNKFGEEMSLRTVIRRACKPFINSSSDAHLLRAVQAADEFATEAEVAEVVAEAANTGPVLAVAPPAIEAEVVAPEGDASAEPTDEGTERRGF